MAVDRMFQVIVLGGIALVGAACGAAVETTNDGGGGFPPEGPQRIDAGADAVEEFPSEGPAPYDAGMDAIEEFPSEGPIMIDAGADDASTDADAGFPQEAPPP